MLMILVYFFLIYYLIWLASYNNMICFYAGTLTCKVQKKTSLTPYVNRRRENILSLAGSNLSLGTIIEELPWLRRIFFSQTPLSMSIYGCSIFSRADAGDPHTLSWGEKVISSRCVWSVAGWLQGWGESQELWQAVAEASCCHLLKLAHLLNLRALVVQLTVARRLVFFLSSSEFCPTV